MTLRDSHRASLGGSRSTSRTRAQSLRAASPRTWAALLLSTWCAMSCGGETSVGPEEAGGATASSIGGSGAVGGGGKSGNGHVGVGGVAAHSGAGGRWGVAGAGGSKSEAGGRLGSGGSSGNKSGRGGGAGKTGLRDAAADVEADAGVEASVGLDARAAVDGAHERDSARALEASRPIADGGALSPDLRASSAWSAFKAFWRRLDGVTGREGGLGYAGSLSTLEHDRWLAELADLLSRLDDAGLLGAEEIAFLRQAATARIEVMNDGGYRYEMFVHRRPLYFEGATEDSIGRLETKIDTLESLRASCLIEPSAYQAALELVEREALTLYVMDEFAELERQDARDAAKRLEMNARDASPLFGSIEGEELLAELSRRVKEVGAQVGDAQTILGQVQIMENRLAALQQALATARVLVEELERCE